jgi:magnesium transporter
MDLAFVHPGGVEAHPPDDLKALLERTDGFAWVDCARWDDSAERMLTQTLGCHPMVVAACRQRNHTPTVHGYGRHVFVILHSPLAGESGHVHLLELDQIIGRNYLVTVHGPINPAVDPAAALEETEGVLRRIEQGRFRPGSPAEMSYAIGTAVARRQRGMVGAIAERLPGLEQQVMGSDFRQPEELLERLFLLRHELLTARTMAAQSHDVYARLSSLERVVPDADRPLARDLADQFDRVRSVADGESQFLFGVIDLYQTRVTTKMTLAMERLAVIAAITLPVTALASIYGMNVIVNERTRVLQVVLVLLVMAAISGLLLRWTKKQGWW